MKEIKNFSDIAFTNAVKKVQTEQGSRENYAQLNGVKMNTLSDNEVTFIENRDSFYLSTVGENNWPYVQFKGGNKGFLKVLSATQIGFADYRGNQQYISTGNITTSHKATLIIVDYTTKRRLKIWAEAEIVDVNDMDSNKQLVDQNYGAEVERLVVLNIKGFDWNCPQHIPFKFTPEEYIVMLKNGALKLPPDLLESLQSK